MKLKIYGVKGRKEWSVIIKAGNASMRVNFEGGTSTARGVIPATYSTSDPVKQAIIERSEYFKHKSIYVVQELEVPDDASARARKMRNKKVAPVAENGSDGSDGHGVPQDEDRSSVQQRVTVADMADAVEWLKEHYPDKGYTATKLRKQEAFNAACEECGVVFEYKG